MVPNTPALAHQAGSQKKHERLMHGKRREYYWWLAATMPIDRLCLEPTFDMMSLNHRHFGRMPPEAERRIVAT